MDERTTESGEQGRTNSYPDIDAIYTAKYDDLVNRILADEAGTTDTNPLAAILGNERDIPDALRQQLKEFQAQFDTAYLVLRTELDAFVNGLEILWDKEKQEHYIGNTLGVTELDLSECELDTFAFPPSLRIDSINLRQNCFKEIPKIPPNVKKLNLGGNDLEFLDASMLPSALTSLNVVANMSLARIDGELPAGLEELLLSDTYIQELNNLPKGLKILDVSRSWVTKIDDLGNIEELTCAGLPQDIAMPELPDSLVVLDISESSELSITKLPNGLKELYCFNCRFEVLPFALPDSLETIVAIDNFLKTLPKIPDGIMHADFSGNPLTQAAIEECQQKGYTF